MNKTALHNGTQNPAATVPAAEGNPPTPVVQVLDRSGQVQRSVALTREGLTVGRRPDHALILEGDDIGRTHLRIDWDGSRAIVTQLSEQHTTRINMVPLRPFEEHGWDLEQALQIGAYQLRLSAPATASTPEHQQPRPMRINSERIGVAIESGGTLTIMPGKAEVVRLKLTNRVKTTDDLHISIEGIPESWVQLTSRIVQVPYGEQKIPLTVTIPDEPESHAGAYTVTIYARSGENPDEVAAASAYWTVAPFARCRLEVNPGKAYGRRQAAYTITVWNEGNEPTDYKISTGDDTSTLVYDFTPPQVEIEPGEKQEVNLQVQAHRRLTGAPQTYNFSVRATQKGNRVANEQAQFVHQAYIPYWSIPFGATSILLLLAMLLWLFGTLPGVPRTPQTLALGYARLNPTPTATATPLGATAPPATLLPTNTPNSDEATAQALTAAAQADETATAVWMTQDDDRDTLSNQQELLEIGSLPDQRDTDGDGLDDDTELALGTNPRKSDTDGDGLKDGDEVKAGLDPTTKDSDGDGIPDPQDPYTPPPPTSTPTPIPTNTPTWTPTPAPSAQGSGSGGSSGSGGGSGSGGSTSGTSTPTIAPPTATPTPTPIPDNRPPVLGAPGAQSIAEDEMLVIAGITIEDPDAGDKPLIVRLSTTNGLLTLNSTTGLTFSEGTNNGANKLVFAGKLADLRVALQRLTYQPTRNFNGAASITLLADDQGNTGKGGAKTDTRSIAVTVASVNDLPQLSMKDLSVREGGSGVISTALLSVQDEDDLPDQLVFTLAKVPTKGSLRVGDRTLTNGSKFTQGDIDDGTLMYFHNGGSTSDDSFTFSVKDSADGKIPQTPFKIVIALNHSPELYLNGSSITQINYEGSFTENSGPVSIVGQGALTVLEADNDQIIGGTVTLTNVKNGNDERLAVTEIGNVTAQYEYNSNSKTGVLTLSGTADKQVYQNILRSATYVNTVDNPDKTDRVIRFAIKDELGKSSAVAETTLHINLINSRPEILVDQSTVTYNENDSDVLIADQVVILDNDDPPNYNGASLTVQIIDGQGTDGNILSIIPNNDVKLLNDPNSTVTYKGDPIGMIVSNGAGANPLAINFNRNKATITAVQAVARRVGYRSTEDHFFSGELLARTLRISIDDGNTVDNTADTQRPLQIKGINDAPVLDNSPPVFALARISSAIIDTTNVGNLVSEIIASPGGDRITDVDSNSYEGIAIVDTQGQGKGVWEYLLPNQNPNIPANWTAIEPVNTGSALVLSANGRIRFRPTGGSGGTNPSIRFVAWDLTDSNTNPNGAKVDPQNGAGTSPYSRNNNASRATAEIVIDP